jgi:abortive infection bacteriophage resistance protein
MPTGYNKPHLAISEQVRLLASRGMALRDPALAAHWLGVVGYYRLSGYWYPYRRPASGATGRSDAFEPDTTFEQVVALYAFDRKLKLLVLDALERVEIAVRFRVGYTLGRRGAYAHLDPDTLDGAFGRSAGYTTWKRKVDAAQTASREDFVQHFRAKYDGRLPVWVVHGPPTSRRWCWEICPPVNGSREMGFPRGWLAISSTGAFTIGP